MKRLIYLLLVLSFTACENSGGSSSDGGSSDDGISDIPNVVIDCRVNATCTTGGAADGATARVVFIQDACADFGSGSNQFALGETSTSTCNTDTCEFTVSSWQSRGDTITTLTDGNYNVVMYVDVDGSGAPNDDDPYRCVDGHSIGASTTSINESITATYTPGAA